MDGRVKTVVWSGGAGVWMGVAVASGWMVGVKVWLVVWVGVDPGVRVGVLVCSDGTLHELSSSKSRAVMKNILDLTISGASCCG